MDSRRSWSTCFLERVPVLLAESGTFYLAVTTFPVLLLLRRFDDNTLTSWQWAATAVNPARVFLLVTLGIAAAYLLSRFPLHERRASAFLFAVSAAAASMFWVMPEVVIDTSRYFTQAKHLELYGIGFFLREWGADIDAWTDMPLVPFLYGLIFRYLGESRLLIQVLNSLLFSSSVVATYHAARVLWGKETGFHSALFLLGMPYLYIQVPLMLTDVPSMFLLVAAALAGPMRSHRRFSGLCSSIGLSCIKSTPVPPKKGAAADVQPTTELVR